MNFFPIICVCGVCNTSTNRDTRLETRASNMAKRANNSTSCKRAVLHEKGKAEQSKTLWSDAQFANVNSEWLLMSVNTNCVWWEQSTGERTLRQYRHNTPTIIPIWFDVWMKSLKNKFHSKCPALKKIKNFREKDFFQFFIVNHISFKKDIQISNR